jgi:dipeptidyl aminopeptidase/acylaminoacyl peptidase
MSIKGHSSDPAKSRMRAVIAATAAATALSVGWSAPGSADLDLRPQTAPQMAPMSTAGTARDADGTRSLRRSAIVWTRFVDVKFSAAGLMIADPRGTHLRRLTHPANAVVDVNAKLSPDGRLVAFERDDADGISHIALVGVHGRRVHILHLGCTHQCLGDANPTWTPDGHHLWFTRAVGPITNDNAASAAIWKTDLTGRHVSRVSPRDIDGRFEDGFVQFAPAGYIVVVRLNLARDQTAVFRMRPDATHPVRLTPWRLNADLPDVSPATSGPTRNLVVFETYGHGGAPTNGDTSAVATVSAAPRSDHHIRYLTSRTSAPVMHFNPCWSPDGTHVAFVRFKSVESDPIVHGDIWTARSDGSDKRPVSISPVFDFRPDWGFQPAAAGE